MNYYSITKYDTANGPGIRTVLWVSGCNHQCKGCHNPQTWDENSGSPFTSHELHELLSSLSPDYISGITLSGGDPLYPSNRDTILTIVKSIKDKYPNKSIWLYTGYLYEDIKSLDILNYIDVLVDGEYIESQRNLSLLYRGSENQRLIDVSKTKANYDEVVLWKK